MAEHSMQVDDGGGRQRRVPVDYPSNSNTAKTNQKLKQEKRPDPVVSGTVTVQKPSLWKRIRGSFVNDEYDSVFQYVVLEVLVPAAKNMISDGTRGVVDGYLFGNTRTTSRNDRPGGVINYAGVSRKYSPAPQYASVSPRERASHDFGGLLFPSRGDAEEVVDALRGYIDQYGSATVRDLYDLAGITADFTDEKWGWYRLHGMEIVPSRGGYLLRLPRTQPIT